MSRIALLLLVLLVTCSGVAAVAYAQDSTVAGSVRDTTGAPVPGANVVLVNTGRGTATDADGTFRIAGVPPGSYLLAVSALGFAPVEVPVTARGGGVAPVNVVLREATLEAGEVIVTATRRAQAVLRTASSVAVLGPDDLQARGVVSLDEGLRYVPGVTVNGNQLGIRGASGFSYNVGSRVLLLVDGAPLLTPDAGGIPFDLLPIDRIARVEVLKGPGSALYGGGALGGVLGVFTHDAPEVPVTSVRLYGGAYAPVRHAAWRRTWDGARQPRPLGGLAVTHARRHGARLGGWISAGYRTDHGYLEGDAEALLHAFGKIAWRPRPVLRVEVLGGATRRRADAFLYWNGLSDPLRAGRISLFGEGATGTADNLVDHLTVLPSIAHVLSSTLSYTVRGRFYRVVTRALDDEGRAMPPEEGGGVGYRLGGEVQATWALRPVVFTAGASGDANAARSEYFGGEDGELQRGQPEGAAFLQAEVDVTERLAVTGGLRLDAYAPDAARRITRLSPKVNAVFAVTDVLAVRAAWGLGFRAPTVAERFTANDDFLPILPNLALRPETSSGVELGVRSVHRLGTATLRTDAALFHTDYGDLIEPTFVVDTTGAGPARIGFRFVNLTAARVRGLDAAFEVDWRAVGTRIGYTWLDTRDQAAEAPLVFRNRHLLVAAATADLGRGLSAGVDVRLASRPERVESDFARFVPDAEARVPVRVVDLRAGWRRGAFEAALIVRNALDYYYVDRPALLAPPRHAVLEVRLAW